MIKLIFYMTLLDSHETTNHKTINKDFILLDFVLEVFDSYFQMY